jgi:hypothetical protein
VLAHVNECYGDASTTITSLSDLCGQREEHRKKNFCDFSCHTRRIITSVALIGAAAVCPGFSCISRAEVAVIIDVIVLAPDDFRYYEGK